jgi:CRISPR-associated protein Cas2
MMRRTCLITYDIANPKRLIRLHRSLKKVAMPIQYSVFCGELTDAVLANVRQMIDQIINRRQDDVRIYILPRHGWSIAIGRPLMPEGLNFTCLPTQLKPIPQALQGRDDLTNEDTSDTLQKMAPKKSLRSGLSLQEKRHAGEVAKRFQMGSRHGITLLGKL